MQHTQMSIWNEVGNQEEEKCQHVTHLNSCPEPAKCLASTMSEAQRQHTYTYFMRLSTRSTDLDISGQISVAACHTLADAAIYAFLSAEAGWDHHTATGIRNGPKPFITQSDC